MPTVLVVDDDDLVRSLVCRMLENDGHEVVAASDGRHALDLIREAVPDLIVTDIEMPNTDGCALLEKVRMHWPSVPVVGMSGAAARHRGSAARFDFFLDKPFRTAELQGAVRRSLSHAAAT